MKIRSKFKDYYDSCQKLGVDDITYMRMLLKEKLIGFCKKLYPVFCVKKDDVCHYAYNEPDFSKIIKKCYPEKEFIKYDTQKLSSRRKKYGYGVARQSVINVFSGNQKISFSNENAHETLVNDVFARYSEPIVVFKSVCSRHLNKAEVNCKLSDYDFGKVFDSFSAYQEIMVYLSNQAIPIKEIPKLDDKTMRDIKGCEQLS